MKANKAVLATLSAALNSEVQAAALYMGQALMAKHLGYPKLASYFRQTALGEMEHAEHLLERLALLGETPSIEPEKVAIAAEVPAQLETTRKAEEAAVALYSQGTSQAIDADDGASLKLFQDFLSSEEKHLEWTRAQQALVEAVGLQNYLTAQM